MEDAKRRRTAIYEAGHVVAHVRLGLGHRRVSIDPRGNLILGTAGREEVKTVSDAGRARSSTLACCAGYAALIAAGHSDADDLKRTRDDLGKAKDLIGRWNLQRDISAWKQEAVELMRRPENVAAVSLIAQYLLAHGRLDSDLVGCVLAFLDGDMPETEFDDYVRFREALG
jgi:hypothetical protein